MRIAIAGVMVVVLAACTATPGATVIVERQPDAAASPDAEVPDASSVDAVDATTESDASVGAMPDTSTGVDAAGGTTVCKHAPTGDAFCASADGANRAFICPANIAKHPDGCGDANPTNNPAVILICCP